MVSPAVANMAPARVRWQGLRAFGFLLSVEFQPSAKGRSLE